MLSTMVVTKQIEPRYHTNYKTEFRLDDRVYLSKLRLINVGASVSGGSGVTYPFNSGVAEIIENMYLYTGNELIAYLREVPQYAAYKFAQRDNAHQKGVLARTALTQMGIKVEEEVLSNLWSEQRVLADTWSQNSRNAVTSTNLGHLRLNDFLEFLNALPYLPRIPNLRLVIEWGDLTQTNKLKYTTVPTSYTIQRPLLVVDEIIDEQILAGIKSDFQVSYLNVEVDRQRISKPANATSIIRTRYSPKTFDQKYLKDLVVALVPDTDAYVQKSGLCRNVAVAQLNERFTFTVNGSQFLEADGIDSPAVRMMFNKISRGALARSLDHYNYARDGQELSLGTGDLYHQITRQAYLTVGVEDQISDFDINHEFQARGTEDQYQWVATDMFLFGRINRMLQVQNGRVLTAF
jgi:hypothetical protein